MIICTCSEKREESFRRILNWLFIFVRVNRIRKKISLIKVESFLEVCIAKATGASEFELIWSEGDSRVEESEFADARASRAYIRGGARFENDGLLCERVKVALVSRIGYATKFETEPIPDRVAIRGARRATTRAYQRTRRRPPSYVRASPANLGDQKLGDTPPARESGLCNLFHCSLRPSPSPLFFSLHYRLLAEVRTISMMKGEKQSI